MDLLQMKNISKYYDENKVLNDVTLTIKEGEIHGLVGEMELEIYFDEYIIWDASYSIYRRI